MRGRKGGSTRSDQYCSKLVKLVMEQNLEPLIVFSFSKSQCEFYATQVQGLDLTSDSEKKAIDLIFDNAIAGLSNDDKRLPQVQTLRPVLRRGVGIHHGGLLPILKEIVEILFSEGLIKVLFATETFAMGLNMPARTVLFTATRKFDGQSFRLISSGEYIQMSGRAGRRGKDDRGTVILMLDDTITASEARQLLAGEADRLNSAFHLTNNMVLSLLRVEDINPELILAKSFYQFQNMASLPGLQSRIDQLKEEIDSITLPQDVDSDQLVAYCNLLRAVECAENKLWNHVAQCKTFSAFLQPGRIVKVQSTNDDSSLNDFGWAILLKVDKASFNNNKKARYSDPKRRFHQPQGKSKAICLLQAQGPPATASQSTTPSNPTPLNMLLPAVTSSTSADDDSILTSKSADPPLTSCQVASVDLTDLRHLSSICLKLTDDDQGKRGGNDGQHAFVKRLLGQSQAVRRHLWDGVERARVKLDADRLPLLDPINEMKVGGLEVKQAYEFLHLLRQRLESNEIGKRDDISHLVQLLDKKTAKLGEMDQLQSRLDSVDRLLQLAELRARKRLLRRLQFCSLDDVIQLKGRIACELSSGDELMLTELLLDGFFSPLTPVQLASVLSCFVTERSTGSGQGKELSLRPDMEQALKTIQAKARMLVRVANECRISCLDASSKGDQTLEATQLIASSSNSSQASDEQSFVDKFSGNLMEVVRAWAEGVSFARLCQMTSVFEGSVIRCIRRLEELLREMHDASKVAGNSELEVKFAQAIVLIKRDIVFAASLYL